METIELTAPINKQINKTVLLEQIVTERADLSKETLFSVELTQTLSKTVSMYEMGEI